MIRGLVYMTGLATLALVGVVVAIALRVDRWPWRDYAEDGRQYLVDRLEQAKFEEARALAPAAPAPAAPVPAPAAPPAPRPAPLASVVVRHTVARGETLYKIAAHYYGVPERWAQIARANEIRRPEDLKVGRVIAVPMDAPAPRLDGEGLAPRLELSPAMDLDGGEAR